MANTIKSIKSLQEFNELISSNKRIMVDFTAAWCGPCRVIGPVFDKLSEEHPETTFVKVDVDDAGEIASTVGIKSMPTFHLYSDGEKLDEFVGANPAQLRALVTQGL
ncbi:hypothetical protein BGZ68_006605 [Mortierella alpina]|nr:hypothetical protein BGZ68_006605 [Mortierella alpina]